MKYSKSPGTLTQGEVLDAAKAFFRSRGHRLARRVRIRTWTPGMILLKKKELAIVEAKGSHGDVRKALAQVGVYATDATYAYLAVPEGSLTAELESAARALGIGLVSVGEEVRIAVRPRKGSPRESLLRRVSGSAREKPEPPAPRRLPYDRVLRHKGVLDVLFSVPGGRFTIRELSLEAGTSYATTWRIVRDLVSMGALTSERVGPSTVISTNEGSPVIKDLTRLASLELSPYRRVAERFAELAREIPEVRKVILFGSVAEGRATAGSDTDVAVVLDRRSERTMDKVYEIASELQDETGVKVVPIAVVEKDFESKKRLIRDLKRGDVLFERT
ncbi:MAG: nucleotidyltransferase domain-containing protein [Thermoplasmata archaeon]|nr:nucleotidyltransferase domain-containing protein [Candidatus Thermoplasmatota archaeon]MCK4949547.1 nucleotidyltransferase domain-containing protein [Thermoplasmata archaeon]